MQAHEKWVERVREQETKPFIERARELLVKIQDEVPVTGFVMGNGDAFFSFCGPVKAKHPDTHEVWEEHVEIAQRRLFEGVAIGAELDVSEEVATAIDELHKIITACIDERTLECFNLDIGKPGELLGRYCLPTGELITKLPMEAPWMSGMGACLIKILALRKDGDVVMAQLGDEKNQPYPSKSSPDKTAWVKLDEFPNEWPQ